jgi:tetratricopeptide (TPR) repeat protein
MNFPLPSSRARMAILLFACFVALVLLYLGARNALAAHYFGQDTRAGYERAVRLEPGDSRNWYLLGRSYLYDFEQPDPVRAIDAFRKSIALDPYSAEAMLDLATAYDGEGDTRQARAAYVAAKRVYPLSADVSWSYGNFLLRQGELDAAFAEIRKSVELEPKRGAEAFSRAIRVQPDVNVVLDKAVPPLTAVYLPIIQIYSSAGDLDTAQAVWQRLVGLRQKVPMREMVLFFDGLFQQRRIADAKRLWPEALAMMQNAPPADPAGSILWDGGFESAYTLGGGFTWRFVPATRDTQISSDPSEKHSGERSIRILFNGRQNLNFEDVCHNIAPEPAKHYLLTAWIRTQSLTSSEGVRLLLFAFSKSGNQTVTTEEVHGTQPWTKVQLEWTAPADAEFGAVCVKRNMSDQPGNDIQGAAWIDDVSLVPADQAVAKP